MKKESAMDVLREYFASRHYDGPEIEKSLRKEPKPACAIIREWALNSSCCGVPNVERTKYLRKFIWLLIVLVGAGLTVYVLVGAITKYTSFQVKVIIEEDYVNKMPLPAVTICNLNFIRSDKFPLLGVEAPSKIFDSMFEANLTGEEIEQLLNEMDEAIKNVKIAWVKFNKTMKREMGHQLVDMLHWCQIAYRGCNVSDFQWFEDKDYGNCYTFNSGHDGKPLIVTHRSGKDSGLKVELDTQQLLYMPAMTESVGFVVTVHDQNEVPFPSAYGITVPTGMSTEIGLQMKKIEKKPHPYPSKCWEAGGVADYDKDAYSQKFNTSYSKQGCQRTCLAREIMKNCSCEDGFLPRSGQAFAKDQRLCETDEEILCLSDVIQSMFRGELECDCPMKCKITEFTSTVSQSTWPNMHNELLYERKYNESPRETMVQIKIYYMMLNIARVKEEADYTINDLYADLGGNIGLFLGLSVVSLFEIMELCLDLLMACYLTRKYKKSQESLPDSNGKVVHLGEGFNNYTQPASSRL